MSIQCLQVISLALTAIEWWKKSSGPFYSDKGYLTVLAVVALILSVILFVWLSEKHRLSEHHLNQKITDLTVTSFELWQENNHLTATNEELQQTFAELSRKQVEIGENIIEPVNTKEVDPSAKPSRN